MYYKILKDNKIVSVIDNLSYVCLSPKSGRILLCNQDEAQGIVSSDGSTIWHLKGFYDFPFGDYEAVEAIAITKEEYHQWKALNGRTPEEIIDEYTLSLIEGGLL
jgi:hypothetical protein